MAPSSPRRCGGTRNRGRLKFMMVVNSPVKMSRPTRATAPAEIHTGPQGSAPAEVPPGERRIDTHDREERARDAKGQAAAVVPGPGLRVQQWAAEPIRQGPASIPPLPHPERDVHHGEDHEHRSE